MTSFILRCNCGSAYSIRAVARLSSVRYANGPLTVHCALCDMPHALTPALARRVELHQRLHQAELRGDDDEVDRLLGEIASARTVRGDDFSIAIGE